MTFHLHKSHKKHRNVLYSLVILIAVIQITSFLMLSIQVTKLDVKINTELEETSKAFEKYTTDLVGYYNNIYQENFRELSGELIKQKEDFSKEIKILEATTAADFSAIAEEAVESVVTVATSNSIGSGFFVYSSGYVVTNYHVIASNEGQVTVLTFDKQQLPATLVGKDGPRDLALLKVEGTFRPLELAKDEELQVGEKVIAIGNPLGLSFTVTEGIISALDRVGPSGEAEYVQTDVSLNPGNSGGPLIDTQGKVVGINNFKIASAESLGFALKSSVIKDQINAIAGTPIIN
jgi:S1-C subfamily serine protease